MRNLPIIYPLKDLSLINIIWLWRLFWIGKVIGRLSSPIEKLPCVVSKPLITSFNPRSIPTFARTKGNRVRGTL